MGLITDKPEDLPSSNDLDNVEDPNEEQEGERAEIYLSGSHICTLDNAPKGLGRITLMTEIEVYEEAIRFTGENGEVQIPIRKCRRIGDMWVPGTQRPPTKEEIKAMADAAKAKAAAVQAAREEAERAEREENEPPMFDEDGNAIADDAPRPPGDENDGPWPGDVDYPGGAAGEVVHPDEAGDQGGSGDADQSGETDSSVVQFSDKAKGSKK